MNKMSQGHTEKPRAKETLQDIISAEIKKNGNQCDLSHIDVSLVTDFSYLFWRSSFNGNISGWDVSSCENMAGMFYCSRFNGTICDWNVSGVANMGAMFYGSRFAGDLSDWNTSSVIDEWNMFRESGIAKTLGTENPSLEQVKSHFLSLRLEVNLQKSSPGQSQASKVRL